MPVASDSASASAPLVVPWGRSETLALELPASWPRAAVFQPDRDGLIPDYDAALETALDQPGVWPSDLAGLSVAIVVDDPSRWTPVRAALPIVLRRLADHGVAGDRVTISVGVGRHAAVSAEAMRLRVGEAIAARHACFSPPVDDMSRYVELGSTPEGVPVRVFRPVAEAGLRILIGSVLPHLQAGFGGGYKLIFPGCSHRSTLGSLHRQGLDGDARRLLGGASAANPMRQAIRHAAALLPGHCLSISHLIGGPGEILRIEVGHPDSVQDRLAIEAKRRFQAPDAPAADLVIAGNNPWPGDPMQSFKVLLHHRDAGRPNGVLVGLFWTDPAEIDRSFPLGPMRAIAASGNVGGWLLRRGLATADRVVAATSSPAAFMLHWARELVVDRHVLIYAPPLHDRIGPRLGPVRIFNDQQALWNCVAATLGQPPRQVRLFPRGGLSYAPTP